MADVLLEGKILTREEMVNVLVKAGGATSLQTGNCPKFDEAHGLDHAFAERIVRWLRGFGVNCELRA